jgi:MFS family permease
VIYVACLVGGVALVVLGLAPTIEVFVLGAVLMGIATGTFLAVDWALMTDIIPKAASGRYMGISNIAVASAGPLASVIGGTMLFLIGGELRKPEGPRAAYLLAVVVFVGAAFFLRRVDARPREERLVGPAKASAG